MLQIIKKRKDTELVCSFLSSFNTDKNIYVPKLYDGVFETALATNNVLECTPGDDNFQVLWEVLRDEPVILSSFIQTYEADKETSQILSEVLSIQKNKIPRAYILLSLCLRSDSSSLMGGRLVDKQDAFTSEYMRQLRTYTTPFSLIKNKKQECLVFQDLTYLALEEVQAFKETDNCLLITNNKQHVYLFDGASCSQIGEYYLIWK